MKTLKLLLLALATLVTGCSTFNRDWKAATAQPPANGIEGPWQGTWVSQVNGHHGRLRCIVTKQDGNNYRFNFWATYAGVLRFTYGTKFAVQGEGENFRFKGDEDLGKLAGGLYTYEGTIKGRKFDATYQSGYDKGTFQMQRP